MSEAPVDPAPLETLLNQTDARQTPSLLAEAGECAVLRVGPGLWVWGRGPFRRASQAPAGGVAFYVNDFNLSDAEPWRVPAEWGVGAAPALPGAEPLEIAWEAVERGAFDRAFAEAEAERATGRLRKVVLAVPERGRVVEGQAGELMARALRFPGGGVCWSYAWHEGDAGFAGATPECLFTLRGGRLHTMALAGTARPAERAGFEADEKEIREHEFVAETIAAKLAPLGVVKRGPREVLNVGEMLHFITRFAVEVDGVEPDRMIRQLHPTPAMGVLPDDETTRARLSTWRGELETPAGFGAPFGVKWEGGFHAVVAIRGMSWRGPEVSLTAGCGLVEGSRLEREWRELELKRAWVKRALAI